VTQQQRLVGSECLADLIPMTSFPNQRSVIWDQARMTPQSGMGVILSHDNSRAWIALLPPGEPPILLHPLPYHGRLTIESERGMAELLAKSTGASSSVNPSSTGCHPGAAPDAGSPGADPCQPGHASAPGTSSLEVLHLQSRLTELQSVANTKMK
jgi:hypothetical protein